MTNEYIIAQMINDGNKLVLQAWSDHPTLLPSFY